MAFVDLPAFPPPVGAQCVREFIFLLSGDVKNSIVAVTKSVRKSILDLAKTIDDAISSTTAAIGRINTLVAELDSQIEQLGNAIAVLQDFLNTHPCAELLGIKVLFDAEKVALEAERALLNATRPLDILGKFTEQRDTINTFALGLDSFLSLLE